MKIDPRDIRSIQRIERPDGAYYRIGYVKRSGPLGKAGARMRAGMGRTGTTPGAGMGRTGTTPGAGMRKLWSNPVMKTITMGAAAAVIYNVIMAVVRM